MFSVFLKDSSAHELLEAVADNFFTTSSMSWSPHTSSPLTTINIFKRSNTDIMSEVNFPGDSCGPNIQPIRIVWSQFFLATTFNIVQPVGLYNFASFLQMVSKGSYKISRRYILDGQFYLASELFHISTFERYILKISLFNFNIIIKR